MIKYIFENKIITLQYYGELEYPNDYASFNNLSKYIKIISHNKNIIKFTYHNLPVLEEDDERQLDIPFIKDNYIQIRSAFLIKPKENNFNVSFESNMDFCVSSLGRNPKGIYNFDKNKFDSLLFSFNGTIVEKDKVVLSYYPKSFMYMHPEVIINKINTYLKRCYAFFGVKEDIVFLITYVGYMLKTNKTGHGGSGAYGGFQFMIIDNETTKELEFKIELTMYHELFHHFNYNTNDYSTSWFSEGFTEYFSKRIALMDNKKLLNKEIKKHIEKYNNNPYKNSHISKQTKHNFWNDVNYEKLPYDKGFCYALYLHKKYGNEFLNSYKKLIKKMNKKKIKITNNDFKKIFYFDDKFNDIIINGFNFI